MAEHAEESVQTSAHQSTTITTSDITTTLRGNHGRLPSTGTPTFPPPSRVVELQRPARTTLPPQTSTAIAYFTPLNLSTTSMTDNSTECLSTGADPSTSPDTTPCISFTSESFNSLAGSSFTSTSSSVESTPQTPKSILKNTARRLEANQESDDDDNDWLSETTDTEPLDDFGDCDDKGESRSDDSDAHADCDDSGGGCGDESQDDANEDTELSDSFSFISFGNSVRFAETETTVVITASDDDEPPPSEFNMTVHEKASLSRAATPPPNSLPSLNGKEYDPEEHPRDVVDLDKDLLVAYINGLRTVDVDDCKIVLRSRTSDIDFDAHIMSTEIEDQMNDYLDRIVEALLGFFPNLFTEDEYSFILDQAKLAVAFDDTQQELIYEPASVDVRRMLQKVLMEKLGIDETIFDTEVLVWLASELLEPLGRRACSRSAGLT